MTTFSIGIVALCFVLGFGIVLNVMPGRNSSRSTKGSFNARSDSDRLNGTEDDPVKPSSSKRKSGDQDWKQPLLDDWERVLAVAPSASPIEIRKAYVDLIKQYHPDRLNAAAPEIMEYGADKTRAINAAYSTAQRLGRA